ncbi:MULTISPECIES: HigA family addiction module antitoxin [Hyphomicrobiales]|jgi:addiction module HigA family antidote|uniref:HigA family addiction module antitoxin n=1 Tax=Methylobacterium sp. CCH7-A2 TaxID=1768789 RepID=UPI0008312B78|nr:MULTISPECIES: HigA family addiction module antitoxin [Hyphomicrobiales]
MDDETAPREGYRLKAPPHVGSFLKTEIIEPAELSVTAAAAVLGVTRPALSALLNGRAALSAEMALRFEKAFGLSMDTLMRMQNSFDIAQARKRAGSIDVKPFVPAPKAA